MTRLQHRKKVNEMTNKLSNPFMKQITIAILALSSMSLYAEETMLDRALRYEAESNAVMDNCSKNIQASAQAIRDTFDRTESLNNSAVQTRVLREIETKFIFDD
jgi:hypothetical protein